MAAVSWVGFAAGIAILLLTASSVLGTLIVPRATAPRLTVLVTALVRGGFLLITDRVDDYLKRDRIEALNGPALLMSLLVAWVGLVFLSYALLFWPFVGGFGVSVSNLERGCECGFHCGSSSIGHGTSPEDSELKRRRRGQCGVLQQSDLIDQFITFGLVLSAEGIRVGTALDLISSKGGGHVSGARLGFQLVDFRAETGKEELLNAAKIHCSFGQGHTRYLP